MVVELSEQGSAEMTLEHRQVLVPPPLRYVEMSTQAEPGGHAKRQLHARMSRAGVKAKDVVDGCFLRLAQVGRRVGPVCGVKEHQGFCESRSDRGNSLRVCPAERCPTALEVFIGREVGERVECPPFNALWVGEGWVHEHEEQIAATDRALEFAAHAGSDSIQFAAEDIEVHLCQRRPGDQAFHLYFRERHDFSPLLGVAPPRRLVDDATNDDEVHIAAQVDGDLAAQRWPHRCSAKAA